MEERVKKILYQINEVIPEYKGNNMLADGIIGSLDMINIITKLEDEFNIQIDVDYINEKYLANMDSIVEMIRFITSNR